MQYFQNEAKYLEYLNENNKNHLLPSSKEIANMDDIDIERIIREREEREGEEEYQKRLRMAVF